MVYRDNTGRLGCWLHQCVLRNTLAGSKTVGSTSRDASVRRIPNTYRFDKTHEHAHGPGLALIDLDSRDWHSKKESPGFERLALEERKPSSNAIEWGFCLRITIIVSSHMILVKIWKDSRLTCSHTLETKIHVNCDPKCGVKGAVDYTCAFCPRVPADDMGVTVSLWIYIIISICIICTPGYMWQNDKPLCILLPKNICTRSQKQETRSTHDIAKTLKLTLHMKHAKIWKHLGLTCSHTIWCSGACAREVSVFSDMSHYIVLQCCTVLPCVAVLVFLSFFFRYLMRRVSLKVGLGMSQTNTDSQWNPVFKALHRFHCCGNETNRW